MKNKFGFTAGVALVALLGCLGLFTLLFSQKASTASQTENRMLQGFPKFSISALASGRFSGELDDFLSDNFVGRDATISASEGMLNAFNLISGDEAFEKKSLEMEQRLDAEGGQEHRHYEERT